MPSTTKEDEPRTVRLLRDALSDRLGRPAVARKGKGKVADWVINDPCFAWLQQGKQGIKGYRSGILVSDEVIEFFNLHSRALAEFLKANLRSDPRAIVRAAEATAHLRTTHFVGWSSVRAAREGLDDGEVWLSEEDWPAFKTILDDAVDGIPADLFPVLPNSGKGGGDAIFRGTRFELLLADTESLATVSDEKKARDVAEQIVDGAWELFSRYYPWEGLRWRSTDLARFLRSAGIVEQCEFTLIEGYAAAGPCDGRLEAAHIKPDASGGSDRAWNGLWLCNKHHRATEGKLRGERDKLDMSTVRVRFLG